ncbi:hypothetical protein [Bradyrhizobium sp. WSM1743]|uniref:hypothetical protein n=1 Tax=Bradyrhizobium sp. WSM1743 TaxID=318996 RepID=UPI0012EB13F5|nr:hypothetical protein [Bradyrhizobium sp. WSM1743]
MVDPYDVERRVVEPSSQVSSPDLIGRSSIPEAAVIESRGRSVLDAPVKPGHDSE